jgi:hypothetical protein
MQGFRAITSELSSQFSDLPKADHEKKIPTTKSTIPKKIIELKTFTKL